MKHYYIFIENEKINGCGEVENLNPKVQNIEISEEIFNKFINDPTLYIFSDGKIIFNQNHELEKKKIENQKKLVEIEDELKELDKKRIRAICENEVKDISSGETWLDYYNKQVQLLRTEHKNIESQL